MIIRSIKENVTRGRPSLSRVMEGSLMEKRAAIPLKKEAEEQTIKKEERG